VSDDALVLPMDMTRRPARVGGVLLDLDGTLVDSEPIRTAATADLLHRLGVELTPEDLAKYTGYSARAFWESLQARFSLPGDPESLGEQRAELIVQRLQQPLDPFPGVRELISLLDSLRLPRAVASSSLRAEIFATLQSARLLEALPIFVSGNDDVAAGKPAPDVYLKAARRLGVPPTDCVALEDSFTGVASAKAAGAFVVAVPCPGSAAADLSAADVQLESVVAFVPWLREVVSATRPTG
jgi:HAD superfamily hydrolase (TIGR01509 family)